MSAGRIKLLVVLVVFEISIFALLLFLLQQSMMPARLGVIIVWFLPVVFGLHVTEEFAFPGGFKEWDRLYRPEFTRSVTDSYLAKLNAGALIFAVLASLGAFDYRGGYAFGLRSWLLFLSVLLFNAFFHIRGTAITRHYSPGLITGILGYIPLTGVAYYYFIRTRAVDPVSAVFCFAGGVLLQPALNMLHKHRSQRRAAQ